MNRIIEIYIILFKVSQTFRIGQATTKPKHKTPETLKINILKTQPYFQYQV